MFPSLRGGVVFVAAWLSIVWTAASPADSLAAGPQPVPPAAFRSPVAVALVAGGERVVTANADAGTLSLIDPAFGVVLDELMIGDEPAWVAALGPNRVVATTLIGGDLVIVSLVGDKLVETGRLRLGFEPEGLDVSADGTTACVALSAVDRVAIVDLATPAVRAEVVVGRLPRFVACAADGRTAAVTCSAESGVVIVDTEAAEVVSRHPFKGLNVGQPGFAADGRTVWFPWTYDGGSHPSRGNIRRGWVTGSRVGKLSLDAGDAAGELAGLTLDVSGRAVGDVRGLELLVEALGSDVAASVWRAAARGLGQLNLAELDPLERARLQERCLGALLAASGDGEWVVRYAVAVALESLAAQLPPHTPAFSRSLSGLDTLCKAAEDNPAVVCLRAELALTRLRRP